ncbi:hypothetical protein V1512DRAFT_287120 [Lipomyces arxii]|uniref:uncharacterized protein n=1 Tax=Lipomyces arxii TaxID=56418 RepID=UPI0034CF6283
MSTSTSSWMDAKRMEAVEKVVLQRAKISKITRQLKSRLALASFKTKRGWENLALDTIEPRVAEEVARRKSSPVNGHTSHANASLSSPINSKSVSTFPLPPLPTKLHQQVSNQLPSIRKQHRANGPLDMRKRARTLSHDNKTATSSYMPWKSGGDDDDADSIHGYSPQAQAALRLNQSSPVYPGIVSSNMTRYSTSYDHHDHRQSFRPTLPSTASINRMSKGSPTKAKHSGAHNQAIGKRHRRNKSSVNSVGSAMSVISSASTTSMSGGSAHRHSPPHTPPSRTYSLYEKNQGFSRTGEEGADLLMFLATSPSPAQRSSFAHTPHQIRSSHPSSMATPPSHQRSANSVSIGTPLLSGPSGAPPQTPSQGFNFSDYVNNIFTPSPAQVQWSRTPIITPARRRLNFDQIPGSESSANTPANSTFTAMEVGPSLMP